MAKRKKSSGFHLSKPLLGGMIFAALLIQYVLPQAGIKFLNPLAIILYLIVGIYLLFF